LAVVLAALVGLYAPLLYAVPVGMLAGGSGPKAIGEYLEWITGAPVTVPWFACLCALFWGSHSDWAFPTSAVLSWCVVAGAIGLVAR
jgi:hypothetical protein